MSFNFTGDIRSRPNINLGGQQRERVDLIQRAKQQREEREQQRARDNAAHTIQTFILSRHSAYKTRSLHRSQFDSILSQPITNPESIVSATRLLAFFWVEGNSQDIKRAAKWCRTVLRPLSGAAGKTPILFSIFTLGHQSWPILIRRIAKLLLQQATLHPSIPQAPLFLEITKMLCDPTAYAKWNISPSTLSRSGETTLEYLLSRNFYQSLSSLITSVPTTTKQHPIFSPTVHLTLLPFKAFPPTSPNYTASLTECLSKILTIPNLTSRLPSPSLTTLSNSIPLSPLLLLFSAPSTSKTTLNDELFKSPEESVHLLSTLLSLVLGGGGRIDKFESGKVLVGYFELVSNLMDSIPKPWFVKPKNVVVDSGKGKGKEVIVIDDDSDEEDEEVQAEIDADGDIPMNPPSTSSPLSLPTLSQLALLSSRSHLLPLLTLSSRFSASSRPALAKFLVSLLASLRQSRELILNIILFGPGGSGLLREIWRGYCRSSPLIRILSGDQVGINTVINTMKTSLNGGEGKFDQDWNCLILLTELYSRVLLTLGDDEFFSDTSSAVGGGGGGGGGGKNPLMIEEVVGLSGVLRNLSWAMFCNTDVGGAGEKRVAGTGVTEEEWKTLVTGCLQQIHARDSRRPFTPKDHWLMTSQFDLNSFIQSVVYEDEQLSNEGDDSQPTQLIARRNTVWDDDDGDEDDEDQIVGRGRRTPAASRAAALTKRQLAFISPRLGVLNNIPFVIPFETRVAIFRQFISNDRKRLGIERDRYDRRKRHRAVVRRNHLAEDSFKQLNGLGAALKSTIEIVFIDEHGMEESGIDGGGLFKELLTSLSKEAFDTDRGLWLATTKQELYPNPHSYARDPAQLQWYAFIGRILGKALYEGILVDVRFASFFLSKWLGRQSYLDDLASLDPELYNGLVFLKNYTGDVEDLFLNFTVSEDDFGISRTISLIKNGAETAVTKENRMQYIFLMAHYRLNGQITKQCDAFFSGLSEIIPARFLRLFNQVELRELVGGVDQPIDIEDLKLNTVYGGWDNDEADSTIIDFWDVVSSFDKEQRANLVQFVTACKRPPLLGFGQLNPRFAIRNAGTDQERLPTSSTCVNLLKMPAYKNKEALKAKLLYAINAQAGFDLS